MDGHFPQTLASLARNPADIALNGASGPMMVSSADVQNERTN
jgi:hypothetical protein